jgi:hypothetical protein
MPRPKILKLIGIAFFLVVSESLAFAVPSLPWFDFRDTKLNQQANGAVRSLDSGLAAFFEMLRVSGGEGSNDSKQKDFRLQQNRARDALDAAVTEFSTLASSLPDRKFNIAPLAAADANTFQELRNQFKVVGLGYPENGKEFFSAVSGLIKRLSADVWSLKLGSMDRKLFFRIVQSKILLERIGASTHIVELAMM